MAFKGTSKRDAKSIARVLESVGGDLNAFTDREYVCFHATVLAEHVPLAVGVLAELVLDPTFPEDELERERRVLLQELAMVDETPEERLGDVFFASIWPNNNLGRAILGTKKTIKGFARSAIVRYHKKYYRPERMVLSVAGNTDFGALAKLVEKHFPSLSPSSQPVEPVLQSKAKRPRFTPQRRYLSEDHEQAHLLVGYESVSFTDANRFDVLVLSFLLGGGMSSRLFQAVRETAGLAYSVDCDMATFTDTGLLTVSVATSPKALPRCLAVLRQELERVRDEMLTKEELTHVQNQLRGTILLGSDQMETRQESLGRNELVFGRYVPVEEVLEAIARVTPEGVSRAAKTILRGDREAVVALGPGKVPARQLTVLG